MSGICCIRCRGALSVHASGGGDWRRSPGGGSTPIPGAGSYLGSHRPGGPGPQPDLLPQCRRILAPRHRYAIGGVVVGEDRHLSPPLCLQGQCPGLCIDGRHLALQATRACGLAAYHHHDARDPLPQLGGLSQGDDLVACLCFMVASFTLFTPSIGAGCFRGVAPLQKQCKKTVQCLAQCQVLGYNPRTLAVGAVKSRMTV